MPLDMPPMIQSQARPIMVQRASDLSPLIFAGFVASGSEADMAKLEAAAKDAHLDASRVQGKDGTIEVMLFFAPGSDRRDAFNFYHHARDGDFGALKIEVMVIAPKRAHDVKKLPDDAELLEPKKIREAPRR